MAARRPELARVIAAALVAVTLIAGSAFVWIGIPVLGLWTAGELTTTAEDFLLLTLGGVPLTMVAFGWLLYRLNALYESLRRDVSAAAHAPQAAWLVSSSDERRRLRRNRAQRQLIDVAMSVSVGAALVLLGLWFFVIADMSLVINR